MSGAGSVVCGSAMRMACSTLVSLSGHVHVLLYLQEDLREERQTQGNWRHVVGRLIYALVCRKVAAKDSSHSPYGCHMVRGEETQLRRGWGGKADGGQRQI